MKYQLLAILGLIVLTIGILIYSAKYANNQEKTNALQTEIEVTPTQVISVPPRSDTKSVGIGNVVYKISPKNLSPDLDIWEFEIVLDTHTGSLDQDLAQVITLTDNQNNVNKAISWQGDPPGGHHRVGVLQFKPFKETESVTLKITDNQEQKRSNLKL